MNLYKVEVHGMFNSCWVYVAAHTPNDAQDKAMEKMKELEWKYDNYAGTVELIALGNYEKGANLLIL